MLTFSNWRDANTTVAGSWGMDIDRLRVAGKVIDGGQYYVSHAESTMSALTNRHLSIQALTRFMFQQELPKSCFQSFPKLPGGGTSRSLHDG
jgi:hypothetical protein